MDKNKIYTMPEAFMEDTSVPIQWRLYGLVNGFWVNSLPVYASNKFFAEKLKCSERHISSCFEQLEKMGLITRHIQGYKRLILQGGLNPEFRGGGTPSSVKGELPVQPNASSNASSINAAEAADSPLRIEKTDAEGNTRPSKITKPPANELALKGVEWARKRGRKFVNVPKQIKAINGAFDSGITQSELVSRWKEMENDEFWSEKGFDWMNVVNSFDRK